MITPASMVASIRSGGFTHVVWIPDTHLGTWDSAIRAAMPLIRPCREGEAVALAAGLMLGGAKPLVMMQCTGFFEAGDAVRNVVHDMKLPLKLLVGIRSAQAKSIGKTTDNCPDFAEPIVEAWKIPYAHFDPFTVHADATIVLQNLSHFHGPAALLWAE